jgi:hypothetical protein
MKCRRKKPILQSILNDNYEANSRARDWKTQKNKQVPSRAFASGFTATSRWLENDLERGSVA